MTMRHSKHMTDNDLIAHEEGERTQLPKPRKFSKKELRRNKKVYVQIGRLTTELEALQDSLKGDPIPQQNFKIWAVDFLWDGYNMLMCAGLETRAQQLRDFIQSL